MVEMVPLNRATFYRLSLLTMSPSATVWPQFLMQSCCIQPSLTCAELPQGHIVS